MRVFSVCQMKFYHYTLCAIWFGRQQAETHIVLQHADCLFSELISISFLFFFSIIVLVFGFPQISVIFIYQQNNKINERNGTNIQKWESDENSKRTYSLYLYIFVSQRAVYKQSFLPCVFFFLSLTKLFSILII